MLEVHGTKWIGIVGVRIILIEWPDAIAIDRVESNRSRAQIHRAAREQPYTAAPKILGRGQEIGG
jgi:hypothetical protein